jgi:ATP-dependent 26S proteasome regulatory subunit
MTLEPKINDKKELNKMLAMAFNVAKTFPPAIIYLDEIEQIFKAKKKKKKGAGGAAGPNFTKLKKVLSKYKKKVLKKEDRVAVIGSTNKPW